MTSSLKLEAGKRYRRRNGEVVGPLVYEEGFGFPFSLPGEALARDCFKEDGRVWESRQTEHDLVEEIRDEPEADPVNRPSHYTQGGVECIDAIKAAMSGDEFRGFLRGNVIKYLWRYKLKGGAESLAKAQWYLARLQSEIA